MQIKVGGEGKKAHGKTAAEKEEYLPKKKCLWELGLTAA